MPYFVITRTMRSYPATAIGCTGHTLFLPRGPVILRTTGRRGPRGATGFPRSSGHAVGAWPYHVAGAPAESTMLHIAVNHMEPGRTCMAELLSG